MTFWTSLIVIIPLICIFGLAIYSRRYVRDIADYLAAGRVAGRYVLCVGDLAAGLSILNMTALCEQNYRSGMAMMFWSNLTIPLSIIMALTGFCMYRYRQSKCLSMGQFLEMRYSRKFRIVSAFVRTLAETTTNAIGPAVAVRFFIYFLGLPHKIPLFGYNIPTYSVLVVILLLMALALIWPAGRISLLLTDCIQGIISYPIFVIVTVFLLTQMSWFSDVTPVMLDRASGESFLNPTDISSLRDFNSFALIVLLITRVLNRASWLGNDTSNAGKNPHEQKMAAVLGDWKNGFSVTMTNVVSIFIITFMLGASFAPKAHQVRQNLAIKVASEVFEEKQVFNEVKNSIQKIEQEQHIVGVDTPYSQNNNPDTKVFESTLEAVKGVGIEEEVANAKFQEFRSIYNQMMMPTLLKSVFPPVILALFALLMIMLMLSTDDSRIFNSAGSIIQDIILPFRKTPLNTKQHLKLLKLCALAVTVFFLIVSLFFAQLDYINMFISIMTGVWLGGAGPIMIGGLYTKWGNTVGAWCALIMGSGTAGLGLFVQRKWASLVYPWLNNSGYVEGVGKFLENVSAPFNPYIVWEMNAIKFPINSIELAFIAMMLGLIAYVSGSLLTYKGAYNLDRLFHRGVYSESGVEEKEKFKWSFGGLYKKIFGITKEYTKGDKIISWGAFIYSFVYNFLIMFVGIYVAYKFFRWGEKGWSLYFFISIVCSGVAVGVISTFWFLWGGIRDFRALLRDLRLRVINPLDNGFVEGNVSLSDKAHFEEIEKTESR